MRAGEPAQGRSQRSSGFLALMSEYPAYAGMTDMSVNPHPRTSSSGWRRATRSVGGTGGAEEILVAPALTWPA